jgi:long-chain acyl-CoA synthetase
MNPPGPTLYRPLRLADGVHAVAQRRPGAVALATAQRELSFAELGRRARCVAAGALADLGLRPGDRVALLAPNCAEYAELMCGLTDAGAIVATLNPRGNAAEAAAACADCGARVLFAHPAAAAAVSAAGTDAAGGLERTILIDAGYEDWLRSQRPAADADLPPGGDAAPFTLVYSSGTTGRPKGILISHRSRVLTFHAMAMEYGCFGPDDRFLALAPMAHGAGFAFAMAPLYFGARVDVPPRFDPEDVLRRLSGDGITGVFVVPTILRDLFALPPAVLDRHRGRFPRLRAIISNAAALPQALKEWAVEYFGDGLLHETYGSTEAGIVTNIRPRDLLRKPDSVGLPFATTEVRLLDDGGRDVQAGEVGELYSRSPYLFNGYWNQPALTAECARAGGWLSAGDLARRDADGYYTIVDRKKDMVISGGINIYPREIEDVLARHPAVRESAVVGVPDDRWGERLRACIVLAPGATASADAIVEHCRGALAAYKVPREIRFVAELPRNSGGKVLKRELRTRP